MAAINNPGEPAMPGPMRQEIERMAGMGENPTWVGSKWLKWSDVMPNLSRLLFSGKALLEGQLSAGEKERMGVKGKLGVKMVDGEGGVWELDFMHWTGVDKYVFSNQWIKFVEEFGVVEGRLLQIWCFRDTDSQLCFAFNVMEA